MPGASLAAAVQALADRPVVSVETLGAGSLSEVALVVFDDGERAVAKRGDAKTLANEALLLRHIRASADVPVPRLLGEGEGLLLLEWRADDGRHDAAWGAIGATLKRLHAVTEPRYGFRFDHALGPIAQPNGFSDDWVGFWREKRLLPLARPLPAEYRARVEAVARRIEDVIVAKPAAALLHGDCWSGNILVSGGAVTALIDPACYYGDAEVDLAMLTLFATPDANFWAAYGERDAGWPVREAAYQLWPILVHVRLFGSGYLAMLDERLGRLGV